MISQSFNRYGDRLWPTTGQHGADIARQRLDALDLAALRHALARVESGEPGHAIDLGGGSGMQALRFASLGLSTTLIDQLPAEAVCWHGSALAGLLPLHHVSVDVHELRDDDLPNDVTLLYSQRFLHYLRFDDAVSLLRRLRGCCNSNVRCFVSVSGLQSELGEAYPHATRPVRDRFAPLASGMASRHGISAPVCLYRPQDLHALAHEAGFKVVAMSESPFGNLKAEWVGADQA